MVTVNIAPDHAGMRLIVKEKLFPALFVIRKPTNKEGPSKHPKVGNSSVGNLVKLFGEIKNLLLTNTLTGREVNMPIDE